jgi:hypothetical protein
MIHVLILLLLRVLTITSPYSIIWRKYLSIVDILKIESIKHKRECASINVKIKPNYIKAMSETE